MPLNEMDEKLFHHRQLLLPHEVTSNLHIPTPSTQPLIPSLPDELSLQILARLPVHSLIRFTTVSKSWDFSINSRHFTKSHLSMYLSGPCYSRRYLLHSTIASNDLHQCSFHSLLNGPDIVPQQIIHPGTGEFVWLVGSINGLVCLALYFDDIIFWNPCLRKYRRLPRLDVKNKDGSFIFGFGYDDVGDDYKVVGIFCVLTERNVYGSEIMVYSRKTDSWKMIQGFKGGVLLDRSGIFVNGKLHWVQLSSDHNCKQSIVGIDVRDESVGELDPPNYGGFEKDFELGVMGDWICVLCGDDNFWVMKEYGVRDSWTKFASMSCLRSRSCIEPPLYLLNKATLLLMPGSTLILCVPQHDLRIAYGINNLPYRMEALVYVESLVLP